VVAAWQAGADGIKVFPCSALGGAKYIRALKGPFPDIEFVPTGGVNLDTVSEFLAAGCCAVGVGSELVDAKLINANKFDELTERARQYKQKIVDFQAAQ
jgi:2-dehydro-3-deoxyphosphogluconate aldolase/(4S)-4-hydroxy-2-oxoglutarate aldolase